MRIEFKIDAASMNEVKIALAKAEGIYPKVMSRAINSTLTTVRSDAVDAIANDLNLSKTFIRNSFTVRRATYTDVAGAVISSSAPISLIHFAGTRQLAPGKGVSVRVKKSQPIVHLKHAFIEAPKGGEQVWERAEGLYMGRAWKRTFPYHHLPRHMRLPIEKLTGPRITDEYGKEPIVNAVAARAGEVYAKNLDHELDYELSQL